MRGLSNPAQIVNEEGLKKEIIKCLNTTQLGVEGNIPVEMFVSTARVAIDELINENICETEMNDVNLNCLRLVDQVYPNGFEELMIFREYCDKNGIVTYQEYLEKK